MKTANLEDLKRDGNQLEAFALGHEIIHLIANGHAVAMLTPLHQRAQTKEVQWPDFAAQQQAIFGDRVLPAGTVQKLIDEERGEN